MPPLLSLAANSRDELSVDQPPLVVPLLVPGIGEEHEDFVESFLSDPVLQNLNGIVAHDPHVLEFCLLRTQ